MPLPYVSDSVTDSVIRNGSVSVGFNASFRVSFPLQCTYTHWVINENRASLNDYRAPVCQGAILSRVRLKYARKPHACFNEMKKLRALFRNDMQMVALRRKTNCCPGGIDRH